MSYNAWLYVFGDPTNGTDPSGLIGPDDAGAADRILATLLATYGVRITRDWGPDIATAVRARAINPTIGRYILGCPWREGSWHEVHELELVQMAVRRTASVLGGPARFRSAMGGAPVDVERWQVWPGETQYPAYAFHPLAAVFLGDVIVTDNMFYSAPASPRDDPYVVFSVVHELGHVWDFRTGFRLSRGLADAVGTRFCRAVARIGEACSFMPSHELEPPPGSVESPYAHEAEIEDWAESFANYVYPAYLSELRRLFPRRYLRLEQASIRFIYVGERIRDLP
jgi:hypothetical protein